MISRIPVKSSHLKSVGYDREQRVLEVEFVDGGVYRYTNVPSKVHVHLMTSESKGEFLHRAVRGKYDYTRVGTEPVTVVIPKSEKIVVPRAKTAETAQKAVDSASKRALGNTDGENERPEQMDMKDRINAALAGVQHAQQAAVQAPKRRGRPPKVQQAVDAAPQAPKRRGRPPKNLQEVVAEAPKRRGRPPKNPQVSAVAEAPKRRGRPPKNPQVVAVEAPKRRGRPPKAQQAPVAAPKRRGRPPKVSQVPVVQVARRGRPPKNGATVVGDRWQTVVRFPVDLGTRLKDTAQGLGVPVNTLLQTIAQVYVDSDAA